MPAVGQNPGLGHGVWGRDPRPEKDVVRKRCEDANSTQADPLPPMASKHGKGFLRRQVCLLPEFTVDFNEKNGLGDFLQDVFTWVPPSECLTH